MPGLRGGLVVSACPSCGGDPCVLAAPDPEPAGVLRFANGAEAPCYSTKPDPLFTERGFTLDGKPCDVFAFLDANTEDPNVLVTDILALEVGGGAAPRTVLRRTR